MLRAYRVLFVVFFMAILFANGDQLRADYTTGPYEVHGVGSTPAAAMWDAMGQYFEIKSELMFVDGLNIVDSTILEHGHIGPNTYELLFRFTIGDEY